MGRILSRGAHSKFVGKGHPDFIWKRHPDFGVKENPDLKAHLSTALEGVKEALGLEDFSLVDKAYLGRFCGGICSSRRAIWALH